MSRSSLAGTTDYDHQSLNNMIDDLKDWILSLSAVVGEVINLKNGLKENDYWKKVYVEFRNITEYNLKFYKNSINEFNEIIKELNDGVLEHHVKRIQNAYEVANRINIRIGEIWHREYPSRNMDFDNPNFLSVQKIYCVIRDMAADMLDLSNLSGRLEDFVGKKMMDNKQTKNNQDIIDVKPNFFGIGLNLNNLWKKYIKKNDHKS
jgi:hypothetical protein